MSLAQLIGEIERLPVQDQLRLVDAVPVGHLAEVERRLAEHDVALDDVVSWDELMADVGPG